MNDIEKEYRDILERYDTKEKKIKYLEECKWQIELVDRWTEREYGCIEVVNKLLKELKGDD